MKKVPMTNMRNARPGETPGVYVECCFARRKRTIKVSAGETDYVEVFREGETLYVLSYNYRYGYFGVEAFQAAESLGIETAFNEVAIAGDIFYQSPSEEFREDWEDLSPMSLVKHGASIIAELEGR